ncbi:isochorismatase family protein [Segeticoccus rhizosphaerae]|uniref:isochorismatase family protein n=1 Tax=Segeticoccus rhizosphaerae TaxID=1104777 RepID=UPI0010BFF725|nr:isochorismatase family protein [Ornithinicoccus soli]
MIESRSSNPRHWREITSEHGLTPWTKGGHGAPIREGNRAALLVIDTTRMYMDMEGTLSIGPAAERIVGPLMQALEMARNAKIPIIYTKAGLRGSDEERGLWGEKVSAARDADPLEDTIIDQLKPNGDVVLDKPKASAFFDTPLRSLLTYLEVDNIFVAGVTTSGCVRATVVDAFSHNLRTTILEDCVADRRPLIHSVSLFDLEMKYAQIMNSNQLSDTLSRQAGSPLVPKGAR